MYITGLLVRRLLFNVHDRTIKRMMLISASSIGIATFALALVAAIMNGFDRETRSIVQGVQPDITISAGKKSLKFPELSEALQSYSSYIEAITPLNTFHGMLKFNDSPTTAPVMIIAIDPESFEKVTRLSSRMVNKKNNFFELFKNDSILVGQTLAQSYTVKPSQETTLLYSTQDDDRTMVEEFPIHIGGIFKTGIDEIDANIIFCSYDLYEKLYGNRTVTSVGIKVQTPSMLKKLVALLREKIPLTIHSWEDLYPAVLSALTLERYAMLLILALIVLVASMNIISLLFTYISHKRADLAMLLSLGLPINSALHIFTIVGILIACIPAIIGLVGASIISWILHHYPIITLPDAYYVNHLPALMDSSIIIQVVLIVIIISFVAARIGARQVIHLTPLHMIKAQ